MAVAGVMIPFPMTAFYLALGKTPLFFAYIPVIWGIWAAFLPEKLGKERLGIWGAILGFLLALVLVVLLNMPRTVDLYLPIQYRAISLIFAPILYYILWGIAVRYVYERLS